MEASTRARYARRTSRPAGAASGSRSYASATRGPEVRGFHGRWGWWLDDWSAVPGQTPGIQPAHQVAQGSQRMVVFVKGLLAAAFGVAVEPGLPGQIGT